MFAFIKGTLIESTPTSVIIETGGIGYRIYIPADLHGRLPQAGCALLLHTSFIVRELSQTLYGFLSTQERDLFEALMGVTGIGPKLALSIIGHISLGDLQQAVLRSDIPTLSKIPGIGKKTAERLMIEMRDKLKDIAPVNADDATTIPLDAKSQQISDVMSALINLGYSQQTAQKALKKTFKEIPEGIDLGKLISLVLQNV
jgi:holliday junction DNA helicase RuvA